MSLSILNLQMIHNPELFVVAVDDMLVYLSIGVCKRRLILFRLIFRWVH